MTQLASISNNHLALHCEACGHNSMIAVKSLIERLGRDVTVHQVVPRLRCSQCKVKGRASFVITYVGESGIALLGARQNKENQNKD